jgi:glycosyltransferase involved in cell wall biosynthesis
MGEFSCNTSKWRRNLKLLHVITTIQRGGAEKQLLTLVSKQIASGNDVLIFYLKGSPELKKELEQVGAKVFGTKWTLTSTFLFVFFRFLKKEQIELIHAHLPAAELLASLLHGLTPLVVTRHNTQRFIDRLTLLSKLLAKLVESQSRACIAISHSVKDFMIQKSEWSNPSSIFVIHYGIDKAPINVLKHLSDKDKVVFLFIGRLVPQKDVPTLLRGFRRNQDQNANDDLAIIGDGKQKSDLQDLAFELGSRRNIRWLGRVENVDTYYDASDVFVLPSRYEGFGLVLLEALRAQIPILAANNSAIPEVLGHQHPGLFRTGDHEGLALLMSATHSKAFREELLKYQNERLIEFNPEKMERKVKEIYLFSLRRSV